MSVSHKTSSNTNYFITSGLASGDAFCNREQEKKILKYNLDTNSATLVISPRRYGKTSLIQQVLLESDILFTHVDLYKAVTEELIIDYILHGVAELLSKIESSPEKLLKIAANFFSSVELSLTVKGTGVSIKWDRRRKNPIETLKTTLEQLDAYAGKHGLKLVMYLDELQSIYQVMRNNYAIEAAIREAMQKSSSVIYIFSGSTRHIIDGMFNDAARPFYRSCNVIHLNRISSDDYQSYINIAAQDRWSVKLEDKVINKILELTENYPYYVNKLCHMLWRYPAPPTIEEVEEIWDDYTYESKMGIDKQLDEMSLNQKRILVKLSDGPVLEPYSSEVAKEWAMSTPSIHVAMKALMEKDHVYQRQDGMYDLLDPLLKRVLMLY